MMDLRDMPSGAAVNAYPYRLDRHVVFKCSQRNLGQHCDKDCRGQFVSTDMLLIFNRKLDHHATRYPSVSARCTGRVESE